jgi:putative lipoprotein
MAGQGWGSRTARHRSCWGAGGLALLAAGCGGERLSADRAAAPPVGASAAAAAGSASATITGTVLHRERVALPPSATLTVRLTDVSKQDMAGMVLAEQVVSPVMVPVPFSLTYDPGQIDSTHTYVMQARIEDDGRLRFINMDHIPVLTRGAPRDSVEVLVKAVR